MSEIDDIPEDLPTGYFYLVAKAENYLEVGPTAYRETDYFSVPSSDLTESELIQLKHGMEQVLQFRGYKPEAPFTGLGIGGFYTLMRVLHFEMEKQAMVDMDDNGILDEMTMVHVVTPSRKLTLYNLVDAS